jgi:anti-anti-sigma factor
MGFKVEQEKDNVKITLSGRLDASNASTLSDELKKLVGKPLNKIIFFAQKLEYISSAGLRVIIFAKQKMGTETKIYFVGAQEEVLSVIKMSGLDNFMYISDSYKE